MLYFPCATYDSEFLNHSAQMTGNVNKNIQNDSINLEKPQEEQNETSPL